MQLTPRVISVIKNFSMINNSMLFRANEPYLSTLSSTKTVMAKAKIDQEFEREFCIYDLQKFLNVLALFKEPDIFFEEKQLRIEGDRQRIFYTYADRKSITVAPKRTIEMPTIDVQFTLTPEALSSLLKAASVLGLSEIAVCGDGKKMTLEAFDNNNSTSNLYAQNIGETKAKFQVVYKVDYFRLIPNVYDVSVCASTGSHFKGEDIEYWIAFERNSTKFGA